MYNGFPFKYRFNILLFFLFVPMLILAKNVLVEGFSRVKQVQYVVRSGPIIFTEKSQNINGNFTEEWTVNSIKVTKEEYLEKIALAEREELEIKQEEEAKRLELEDQKRKENVLKIEKEKELFAQKLKLQTLKRLVSLEIENVEKSLSRLDSYSIQDYYVFEHKTFYSSKELEEIKYSFLSKAKNISVKEIDESDEAELKEVLTKLEALPERINNFFKQSVNFAINKITDTRKLKELLALI